MFGHMFEHIFGILILFGNICLNIFLDAISIVSVQTVFLFSWLSEPTRWVEDLDLEPAQARCHLAWFSFQGQNVLHGSSSQIVTNIVRTTRDCQ